MLTHVVNRGAMELLIAGVSCGRATMSNLHLQDLAEVFILIGCFDDSLNFAKGMP